MEGYQKIELVGDIKLQDETDEIRKAAAAIIDLPKEEEKQQDLLYFTALYVSTGTNLNFAHFLGSEIVAARNTIAAKALDIEHTEDEIIGHLYDYAFMDTAGNKIEADDIKEKHPADLDSEDFHVVIAGVIYKNRFPEVAEEVASGNWKVSMECYYRKFDLKVGELIISLDEAKSLGIDAESSSIVGQVAKVIKKGKEVASGKLARVLRKVMFSGCGIVKNPANPPSVVLETANNKETVVNSTEEVIVFDYDSVDGTTKASKEEVIDTDSTEKSEIVNDDTVGICVSYKKEVIDSTFKGPDTNVLHTDWCSLYEAECTSFSRDTTDPNCLKRKDEITKVAQACVKDFIRQQEAVDNRKSLMSELQDRLDKASKLL